MNKLFTAMKRSVISISALLALTLAGCAAPQLAKQAPVFFPPPPDPPRMQFLKGIGASTDVAKEKKGFSFLGALEENDVKITIGKPYGVAVAKGKIYVCDTLVDEVYTIDLVQQTFEKLKGNKGPGRLRKPINATVDNEGNLFVADTENKEIMMYDAAGNYVRSFGKEYEMKPVDVAVDSENIYALDIKTSEIKVIGRRSGTLARVIGKGSEGKRGLSMPTNLTMDSQGFLYVTNLGSASVIKMDRDGHILMSFGQRGDSFGDFGKPRGIAVDQEGRIYVADASHMNVQLFNEKGRLLMFFGDPGLPVGSMNLPAGVAVTRENLDYFQKLAEPGFILENVVIVTNQYADAKVAFYGLGHMKEAAGAEKADGQKAKGAERKGDEKKAAPEQEKK